MTTDTPTVDQLWYGRTATGLLQTPGVQPRAASAGLAAVRGSRFEALAPSLALNLPTGVNAVLIEMERAPVSLTLRHDGRERIAVHRAVVPTKDEHGRPIIYFTHALVGLPESVGAREVIRLWRSPFWQTSDAALAPNHYNLPTVRVDQLTPGPLGDASLTRPEIARHLAAMIQSYCELSPDQQLVVGGAPDTVATLIFGLCRTLPAGTLGSLSFTTYEPISHLHRCPDRIVGTCWWEGRANQYGSASDEIPADCYQRGLVLHTFTPERSSKLAADTRAARFARFATEALTEGDSEALCRLQAQADAAEINDVASFLWLFELLGGTRSRTDLLEVLRRPPLAAALLRDPDVVEDLINLAANDATTWARQGGPELATLASLAEEPDSRLAAPLQQLGRRAVACAAALIIEQQALPPARCLIEQLAWVADPTGRTAMAGVLLGQIEAGSPAPPRQSLPWETRRWLLLLCTKVASSPEEIAGSRRWLDLSWSELDDLLRQSLPPAWWQPAVALTIAAIEPCEPLPEEAVAVMSRHRAAFESVIRALLADRARYEPIETLLSAARATDEPTFKRLFGWILGAPEADGEVIRRCLRSGLIGAADCQTWIERELLPGRDGRMTPGWRLLADAYLWYLTVEDLLRPRVRALLRSWSALGGPLGDGNAREQAVYWDDLSAFLDAPSVEPEALRSVARAITGLPQVTEQLEQREPLATRLIGALHSKLTSADQLHRTVEKLGTALFGRGNRWEILCRLARARLDAGGPTLDPSRLDPYLAVADEQRAPREVRETIAHWQRELIERQRPKQSPGRRGTVRSNQLSAAQRTTGATAPAGNGAVDSVHPRETAEFGRASGPTTPTKESAADRQHPLARLDYDDGSEIDRNALVEREQQLRLALGLATNRPDYLAAGAVADDIREYLTALPAVDLLEAAESGLLRLILASELGLPAPLLQQVQDLENLASFLTQPGCAADQLTATGESLTRLSPTATVRDWLRAQLTPRLLAEIHTVDAAERALAELGPPLAGGPWRLMAYWFETLDSLESKTAHRARVTLVAAYIRAKAGGARRPALSGQPAQAPEELGRAVACLIGQLERSERRELDKAAAYWAFDERRLWNELKQASAEAGRDGIGAWLMRGRGRGRKRGGGHEHGSERGRAASRQQR